MIGINNNYNYYYSKATNKQWGTTRALRGAIVTASATRDDRGMTRDDGEMMRNDVITMRDDGDDGRQQEVPR